MLKNKNHLLINFLNFVIFSIVIIFQISGFIDISIKNASPILFLPLITIFSSKSTVGYSSIAGFILGAALDSITVNSYCFNTIVFMLLGVGIYLCANNLFNKNLKAVCALAIIASFLYYILFFIVFNLVKFPITNSIRYLVLYAFPSAFYSAVFVIPFYYLYKLLDKLKEV